MPQQRRLARAGCMVLALVLGVWAGVAAAGERVIKGAGPAAWQGDLAPISDGDWSYDRAAHLLERAGFGGTPEEIAALAAMTPEQAVAHLVDYERIANDRLPAFEPSDIHDPGLVNFPPSRPATTELAKETGEALGVKVKPAGNRPLQPVVDKFFYWLRASMLETRRVAYWWADRMLNTRAPARGEDDPVLARSLRDQRGQGARRPARCCARTRPSAATPPATFATSWSRSRRTRRCSTSSMPGST